MPDVPAPDAAAPGFPASVLFCCDHNAVRSPMAEGLMKRLYGQRAYVQSAGVRNDMEIDGFSIAVCAEIGVELARHRSRSFEEMERLGEDPDQFDLIVALSPASRDAALALTRHSHVTVEFWPIADPSALGEGREARLSAYRRARDDIRGRMLDRFGPATAGDAHGP